MWRVRLCVVRRVYRHRDRPRLRPGRRCAAHARSGPPAQHSCRPAAARLDSWPDQKTCYPRLGARHRHRHRSVSTGQTISGRVRGRLMTSLVGTRTLLHLGVGGNGGDVRVGAALRDLAAQLRRLGIKTPRLSARRRRGRGEVVCAQRVDLLLVLAVGSGARYGLACLPLVVFVQRRIRRPGDRKHTTCRGKSLQRTARRMSVTHTCGPCAKPRPRRRPAAPCSAALGPEAAAAAGRGHLPFLRFAPQQ